LITSYVGSTQHTSVTDRQTDERTDGQTPHHSVQTPRYELHMRR